MTGRSSTERILDAYLAPEADRLPDRVIEAALADVARTPQRRALGVPWRFTSMTNLMRAAAAVAIVAIVGVGVLALNPGIFGPGAPTPGPTATAAASPIAAPTPSPAPSEVAPGITAWTSYTSGVYGFTIGYPDDWTLAWAATREWQAGDTVLNAEEAQYADTFAAPEADTIGLFVWEMPAGEGADVESVEGLKAWAKAFCNDVGESSCEEFTQRAEVMCLNAGGDSCRAAIFVPTAEQQYAFFIDWESAMVTSAPDRVRVVAVGREDSFPAAARYGGSEALLKSILTTMDVWTPAPGQAPSA
ncbi:MAG TPA: hypothetical protein VMQ65_06080 [Candidatus Limnocylindria bacterium]|nr:hypothetical protein [Candidatus Limnocylindria bacterium]